MYMSVISFTHTICCIGPNYNHVSILKKKILHQVLSLKITKAHTKVCNILAYHEHPLYLLGSQ